MKLFSARPPRIFLGLTEVSGYFSRLERGLREIGADAMHISICEHRFDYSAGKVPWIASWNQRAVARRSLGKCNNLIKLVRMADLVGSRSVLLVWALFRFDVFILGAGSSFFGLRELVLLRLFRKRVIYTLHGTDARPPYIDGFFPPLRKMLDERQNDRIAVNAVMGALAAESARRLNFLQRLERYADVIVCCPSYSHFLTRSFVNFYAIGVPTPLPADLKPRHEGGIGRPLVVLHAPSQTAGKGTAIIRDLIDRLRGRGLDLDYREIMGRPNHEVMTALREADVVVDQVWSDTPMATFAAEASAHGVPTLVGGYFSTIAHECVSQEWLPPTLFVTPEEMESTLSRMANDRKQLVAMGIQARQFINTQWSERAVAEKMLQLIKSVPPDWYVNPGSCHYFEGCGLDREQARWTVRQLVERYGNTALCLEHAPEMQDKFVAFARDQVSDV